MGAAGQCQTLRLTNGARFALPHGGSQLTLPAAPGDIKLAQVRVLATKLAELAKKYDAAVIMAGDFNSTPDSAIYWFCSAGELALSQVDRRTMSGQLAEPLSPGGLVRRSSHSRLAATHRAYASEQALHLCSTWLTCGGLVCQLTPWLTL